MTNRPESNNLRADLYSKLFPKIIEEDHKTGIQSYKRTWDEALLKWDEGFWDELGIFPVIKNLFYCIEIEEGKDLAIIDSLKDLVNPDKCPEEFLEHLAYTLGYSLEKTLTETAKREVIKSIINLHKLAGKEISWEIFFRMIGLNAKVIPLFKKSLHETTNYNEKRYVTSSVSEILGLAGSIEYAGNLTNLPIKPATLRITVNGFVIKDVPQNEFSGKLLSKFGILGEITYRSGEFSITLPNIALTNLEANYETITDEFPLHAARVDLEIFILPNLENEFSIVLNNDFLKKVLAQIEEIRPIHVLIRTLIFSYKIKDTLSNFATDNVECGPSTGKDIRTGDQRWYIGDKGTGINDDSMLIEKDTGINLEKENIFDDQNILCINPDNLKIEFSNGQPTQWH